MRSDAASFSSSSSSSSSSLLALGNASPSLQFSGWMWGALGSIPSVYKRQCDVRGSLTTTTLHPPPPTHSLTQPAPSIHPSTYCFPHISFPSCHCVIILSDVTLASRDERFLRQGLGDLVISPHEWTQCEVYFCSCLPGTGCRGDVVGARTTKTHTLCPHDFHQWIVDVQISVFFCAVKNDLLSMSF